MSDQVFMSPNNGFLCVGIPLFRMETKGELLHIKGYSIGISNNKPLAYIIDIGETKELMSAEFVENRLICLGDL